MSYTLQHTAEAIDNKLDLIDENKNLLPYPYSENLSADLESAGLEDVGDGSIRTLTPTKDEEVAFELTSCQLPAGRYTVSLDVTTIVDKAVTDSGFYLSILEYDLNITNSSLIELDNETTITVRLHVPKSFSPNLLIKPQIEVGEEKTDWVPYMNKVGAYVDERFNGANTKIRAIIQQLSYIEPVIQSLSERLVTIENALSAGVLLLADKDDTQQ